MSLRDRITKIAAQAIVEDKMEKRADIGDFGEPVKDIGQLAALLALVAPPAIGYAAGHSMGAFRQPTEGDWDTLRKQRIINALSRYSDRAEQKTRQTLGAGE